MPSEQADLPVVWAHLEPPVKDRDGSLGQASSMVCRPTRSWAPLFGPRPACHIAARSCRLASRGNCGGTPVALVQGLRNHGGMFDALQLIEDLQAAVQRGDRERVEAMVSDRMIWVMPLKDNVRGKPQWIEASLGVTWNWFRVSVHREVDLGQVRVVESWIEQSREPVDDEDASAPVIAEGVVVDVWTQEDGAWRLVSRHPQRST